MGRMQRCLGFRNARVRENALTVAALLAVMLSTAACDWFIPHHGPPTSREDTAPPNPNPTPEPVSAELTRAPYLQSLGGTEVTIAFRTQSAVGTTVDYGRTLDYGASVTDESSQIH